MRHVALGRDPQRPAVGADRAPRGGQRDAVGAFGVPHRFRAEALGEPGDGGDRVRQRAAVPVEQDRVAERADDGDALTGPDRQQSVVAQQDDRAPGGLAGQPLVVGTVDDVGGDAGVRVALRRVELAEAEPDAQHAGRRPVDVGRRQQPALQCFGDAADRRRGIGAVLGEAVDAGPQRGREGGDMVGVKRLLTGEVAGGAGVADDEEVVGRPFRAASRAAG